MITGDSQEEFQFDTGNTGNAAVAELEQDKRSALLDKISALLAKTEENGCTESEAVAAAGLAQKLMAKYGLSLSEIQAIESPSDACGVEATPIGNQRCHEVSGLMGSIAFFTDTRIWYNRSGIISIGKGRFKKAEHDGINLVYFGLPAGDMKRNCREISIETLDSLQSTTLASFISHQDWGTDRVIRVERNLLWAKKKKHPSRVPCHELVHKRR
jgi:hypothetical protein